MKIAIISDIHDNLPNLQKVLDYCRNNKIKKIICCGDFGSEETFDKLAEYQGEIFTVLGNMDTGYVDFKKIKNKHANVKVWEKNGRAEIGSLIIGFTHEPEKAKVAISREKGEFDFYFYGHTHKPWEEKFNNVKLINPGNVANQYYPPSFAVMDLAEQTLELVLINNLF